MREAPEHEVLLTAIEAARRPVVAPRAPAEPVVTVSMPARNAARFIESALRSVLGQQGVDLEVIVVDDASTDGTARIVESIGDPRIRLYRRDEHRGIGASHNLVVEEARGAYVAHVDADDLVLPGGLAAMIAPLREDDSVAQAYCDFVEIDGEGRIDPTTLTDQLAAFERRAQPDVDYRRELLVHGMVANHLRTYRRSAIRAVGGFDETLEHGEDWAMAVALADRWELRHVPGVHYCRRVHGTNVSVGAGRTPLRFWRGHVATVRRMMGERRGRLLGLGRPTVAGLLLLGLLYATGVIDVLKRVRRLLPADRGSIVLYQ